MGSWEGIRNPEPGRISWEEMGEGGKAGNRGIMLGQWWQVVRLSC